MKKVLFVVTKDDVGGAQKYVKELASKLDTKRFIVKIISGGVNGVRFLSNSTQPHLLFINDLLALGELFFIFRRERPDIVHLNSSKAGVVGAISAKLAGVPKVIFTAHGWVFNPDNRLSWLRRNFYIAMHKLAARFQDRIISVSQYDNQLAIKHKIALPSKLFTVYNGISEVPFIAKGDARRIIKKLTGAPVNDESVWVGSVGRLVAEKNYDTLVEAAAKVPEAHFFIIGTGYELSSLKKKIKKLNLENRFSILDVLGPAAPYLKAFDIFALTSIKEGLPYTMLEAMAAGVPLVVTRIGGMTEIADQRGLVMPGREPEEIARAISYYIGHPEAAAKFSQEAKKFLESNLTLEKMVEATQKIYLS